MIHEVPSEIQDFEKYHEEFSTSIGPMMGTA